MAPRCLWSSLLVPINGLGNPRSGSGGAPNQGWHLVQPPHSWVRGWTTPRSPYGAKAKSSGEGRASLSRKFPLQPRMMGQKTLGLCFLGPEAVALALTLVGPA